MHGVPTYYHHRMSRELAPESTDILCEECGYRLNGLPPTGNCPECGAPIARSTTASPRRLPAWEDDSIRSGVARFNRTAWAIILHPRAFFRTLAIVDASSRSRRFMLICLAVATYLNAKTIVVHYALTSSITSQVTWLPPLPVLIVTLPIVIFMIWWGLLELVAYLSAVEGRFWGYRMQRQQVRRAIHYISVHVPVASLLPMFAVTGFAIMLAADNNNAQFMLQYLYAMSATVVIAAIYLFKVYWAAMKQIMFANSASQTGISAAAPAALESPA